MELRRLLTFVCTRFRRDSARVFFHNGFSHLQEKVWEWCRGVRRRVVLRWVHPLRLANAIWRVKGGIDARGWAAPLGRAHSSI